MEITLKILLYFIQDLQPMIAKESQREIFFLGTHQLFLSENKQDTKIKLGEDEQHQYLYIANLSEVLAAQEQLADGVVILASMDCKATKQQLKSLSCGLVLVDEKYEVPYLINRMINVFQFLSSWDKNMHIAALEGKSVQELIDLSEEVLNYPIIIFDAAFDVLAHTEKAPRAYTNFEETIKRGYTDAKIMNLVKKRNIFARLKTREPVVAPAAEDDAYSCVYIAFYGDQTLLGYACIFLDKEDADEGYLDLLKIFVTNMTFCLKRDYENRRYGRMMHETFLLNLMNPAGTSQAQISDQVQYLDGLSEHGRFILGVVEFEDYRKVPLTFLARQMAHAMSDVKPFIYENQICLLRILDSEKNSLQILSEWEEQMICNVLENYSYTFGISNEFYCIMDLQYAFRQAAAAMKFSKIEGKHSGSYLDYYHFDLFRIMEEQMPIEHLKMGLYRQLQQYDLKNNTRYGELILTYLKCDCNASHTAEKLYLHRNTIRKAVQFVEEKWNIQLSDVEVKKRMWIGELADQYLSLKEQ